MKLTLLSLLLLAASSLGAQAELIRANALLEAKDGKAAPGGEVTLRLQFEVDEGFHAYHKDNPGFSKPLSVKFSELSGLTQVGEAVWPKYHEGHPDKDDPSWVEFELGGKFELSYRFKVPASARGNLTVSGRYDAQLCDDKGCTDRHGDFTAAIEVAPATVQPATPDAAKPKPVLLTLTAAVNPASVKVGGEFKLSLKFKVAPGFHAYHKDNPGYSKPIRVSLSSLHGVVQVGETVWPAYHVGQPDPQDPDWKEYELSGEFSLDYQFKVGPEAANPLVLSGTVDAQVCDENGCHDVNLDFSAALVIDATASPKPAKDEHGFYTDFDAALAEAKQSGKLLMVDFNGKFCPPCRRMEREVFTLPEVKSEFEKFVLVSLLTDVGDAKANAVFDRYNHLNLDGGIPLFVITDGEGKALRSIGATLGGDKGGRPKSDFVRFLRGEIGGVSTEPRPQNPMPAEGWPAGLPQGPTKTLTDRFTLEARFSAAKVKPGAEVTLELRFGLKPGVGGNYYLYHPETPHAKGVIQLFDLRLVDLGTLTALADWQFPEHHVVPAGKSEFGKEEWHFEGDSFVVVRRFRAPTTLQPVRMTGTFGGQVCDQRGCLPFEPFGWVADLQVSADGVEKAVVGPSVSSGGHSSGPNSMAQAPEGDRLKGEIEKAGGFWFYILFAFFGGMATLLTPCVLPVLPLTVGFFVKQAEQKRSPLVTAGIYCLCILVSFTLFGLFTSLVLGPQGAQIIATNGWVNLALGTLFLVFALSFFGLFELRVPTFISARLARAQFSAQQQQKGYVVAALSGSSFSVISFSCSAPIAAAILAGAASGEQWLATVAMLAYAAGMALPIFVMGQFPALMKKMPKSGGWMNAMKVVFAFIELGLAVRYFAWAEMGFKAVMAPEAISRNIVIAMWVVCAMLAGAYLLGFFRLPHDHEKVEQLGVVRLLFATLFLVFGLYLVPGLLGSPMGFLDGILPPAGAGQGGGLAGGHKNDVHSLPWKTDLDEALAEAKKQNKPVFVDFTGILCSNCRWVETNIFPQDDVFNQLKADFILVQQWTDKADDPKAKENWKKYGGHAVPFYVVLDADGKVIEQKVPSQLIQSMTVTEFATFMKRANSGGSVQK